MALQARGDQEYRSTGGQQSGSPTARSVALDAGRLKRVLDFIEGRFADDVSLDVLAAQGCLSPFHFSRRFREATGLSPHRYLTRRRMLAAQEMLAADRVALVQIAHAVGFESQASFTRAFRKNTGLTPGRYRQLHRPAHVAEPAGATPEPS